MSDKKQIIISIDREFGSGGRDIAHLLGDIYQIPVYHHSLLEKIGIASGYNLEEIRNDFDETPRKKGMTRTVRGFTNSNSEHIAQKEFELLRKLAEKKESFIVIGHCGETILKDFGVISIFVSAQKATRIGRTMAKFGESKDKAKKRMVKMDKNRKHYHNHYCPKHKWADARYYDIAVNSSRLGIEGTAQFLKSYIDQLHQDKEEQQ